MCVWCADSAKDKGVVGMRGGRNERFLARKNDIFFVSSSFFVVHGTMHMHLHHRAPLQVVSFYHLRQHSGGEIRNFIFAIRSIIHKP